MANSSVGSRQAAHEQLAEIYEMTVLPWQILQWAVDKRLMNKLSDQIGVDHPKTYYPFCAEELASLELSFPVILKPTRRDNFNQLTAAKAWREIGRASCRERE